MNESFDVFLSHNSRDKPIVEEIGARLRSEGLRVWLDKWELRPGFPWQEGIEEAVQASRAVAVFVGKDALGAWQEPEMRAFIARSRREKVPVIPVLLPGCPDSPRLTPFLEAFTWVDLRDGLTQDGIDSLQWGITGKRPDRSKPAAASAVTPEAVATPKTAPAEAQPTSDEARPVPSEVQAPMGVAKERSDRRRALQGKKDYRSNLKELTENLTLLGAKGSGHDVELLQAILLTVLASHEQEKKYLKKLEVKMNVLLGIEIRTGYELVNRALETLAGGRSASLVDKDIASAQSHFTIALSVSENKFEQAIIRHKIGICAFLLRDAPLAQREFWQAYILTKQEQKSLQVPEGVEKELRYTEEAVKSWNDPKTLGDWIWRILLPNRLEGIGTIRMDHSRAIDEYEKALAEIESKKSETEIFLTHIREIDQTVLRLNLDS